MILNVKNNHSCGITPHDLTWLTECQTSLILQRSSQRSSSQRIKTFVVIPHECKSSTINFMYRAYSKINIGSADLFTKHTATSMFTWASWQIQNSIIKRIHLACSSSDHLSTTCQCSKMNSSCNTSWVPNKVAQWSTITGLALRLWFGRIVL